MKALFSAPARALLLPALAAVMAAPARAQSPIAFSLPPSPVAATLSHLEYFVDSDPGYGLANSLPLTPGQLSSATYSISIASLADGAHYLYSRARDSYGAWSHRSPAQPFVIYRPFGGMPVNAAPAPVAAAEYFIDSDPGAGHGIAVPLTPGDSAVNVNIAVSLAGLGNGIHKIFTRTQDAAGAWSMTATKPFSILIVALADIPATPAPAPVTQLEYFIDTDPGIGNGTLVSVPVGTPVAGFPLAVNVSGLSDGSHTLYVRTAAPWSFSAAQPFVVGGAPLPVEWLSFSARRDARAIVLDWQTARESDNRQYTIERSGDGQAFTAIGEQPAAIEGGRHDYRFRDETPLTGVAYYRIRQDDADGRQQYSATVKTFISPDAAISINNPVTDELIVRQNGAGLEKGTVLHITDASGRRLMQVVANGDPLQRIGLGHLSPGNYFLQFLQDGISQVIRFFKQ